jgi:signal transduction histidine kinase
MSLRLRLFLLVAGLVALVVAAQAALVGSLAARLERDVRSVAVTVGEEILSGFSFRTESGGSGRLETHVVFLRTRESVATLPSGAPAPAGEASSPPGRWVEHDQVEMIGAPAGETPERVVEEELGVKLPRAEPSAAAGVAATSAERFPLRPAPGGGASVSGPPRPRVEPDASGAILVRGPLVERRIPVPNAPVVATLARFRSELTAGTLVLLFLGLAAAALLAHRTTRPLGELAAAAERVGSGELGLSVPVARHDEIGAALVAFNEMSAHLAALDRENRRLTANQHLSELAEVARGLAHTLRNPLNALSLAVDRLADEPAPDAAAELAERCRRQIRRIDGSLRSFLALASAPEAQREPVELATLVREVALEAAHDAAGRVKIEVEAPERIELAAVAAEVRAIVQALVVNACEASPDGGRVVVRLARDPKAGARIEVDDDGAGVAPEVVERLFAPHVTTKPNGSGMGLYLAQRLASLRYAGGVELVARQPRGTRATLRLATRGEVAA